MLNYHKSLYKFNFRPTENYQLKNDIERLNSSIHRSKNRLTAQWKMENGKLVCQWIAE
jgi:hypothetical protein